MGSRGQSMAKERRRAENGAVRQLAKILGGPSGKQTKSAAENMPFQEGAKVISGPRYETKDGYFGVENGARVDEVNELMGRKNGGMTDKWEASLSEEELQAVKAYTGRGYEFINGHLRRKLSEREENDPINRGFINRIPALDSAIDKYELERPTIFHRIAGGSLLGGATRLEDIKKLIGTVTKPDSGYMSVTASATRDMERQFMWGSIPKDGHDNHIRYHVKVAPGKGIGAYVAGVTSNKIDEREFLFARGAKFRITGAYETERETRHGKVIETHVNLEYVR